MWAQPELNHQVGSGGTNQRHDALRVDASRVDEVINDTRGVSLHFIRASALTRVNDDVSGRRRIVLHFNGVVIQSRFFIVISDGREFVELSTLDGHRELHRACRAALEVVPAH